MMRTMSTARTLGCASVIATALGSLGFASSAMADTRARVDVSMDGRVATNPFNLDSPGKAVLVASPRIAPWVQVLDSNTRIELSGQVLVDQYASRYGSDTTASANLSGEQQLSPNASLQGGVGYSNSILGAHAALLTRTGPADAVPDPGTPIPDVSIAGLRVRTESVNGQVSLSLRMSERDSFNLGANGSLSRSSLGRNSDFNNAGASVGYSRRLSERTSASINVQVSKVDYVAKREGDGTIISPQAGIKQQLSPTINLDVSLGASFAHIYNANGSAEDLTILSGQFSLCDKLDRSLLCLTADRTAQPMVIGGVSTSTNVSLGIDHVLNRRDRLSLTARYSRVDKSTIGLGRTTDFAGVLGSFSRQFNDRLSLYISPSYSKIFDDFSSRDANWQLSFSLRYRFGALR